MLGEHQHCGDGLQKSGFSYTPELFMSQGISVFNFKWEDFGVPSLNSLLDMVKVLDSMLTVGGKIAVHCHSGLGRTGVLLAAYLIYSRQLTAAEAISFVRAHRRRAIQTRGQMQIVTNFAKYLEENRPIYSGCCLLPAVFECARLSVIMSTAPGGCCAGPCRTRRF
eukprot:m.606100 g.606100  ORF g.606100 m.606100 type:complete len:166 (-) comp58111_c0_seq7:3496-3993(-)